MEEPVTSKFRIVLWTMSKKDLKLTTTLKGFHYFISVIGHIIRKNRGVLQFKGVHFRDRSELVLFLTL